MDALDMLFDAGDTVEKVHQSVWFALLNHSDLLVRLNLSPPTAHEVVWEPHRGLFDLKVGTGDEAVWIELKIDSELRGAQLHRQLADGREGRVVYALLGFAGIRSRPWATKVMEDKGATVLDAVQVSDALRRVQRLDGADDGVEQLALAYARLLGKLQQRGDDFRTTESWRSAHSLYFFEQLRRKSKDMENAIVSYVANPSGGFEACHWGWITTGGGVECYLQWEHRKLCFKISVEARAGRRAARSAAVEFLRGRSVGPTEIIRPARLGSGKTMTVGIVEGLPVQEAARWPELVGAIGGATRLTKELAECLRAS